MIYKNILITGGSGFIGSHLCERLLLEGHNVYCYDNNSTSSKNNLDNIINHNNFYLIQSDLEKAISICDLIFNLAASVGVKYIENNPISAVQNNINSMNLMFELCTKYNKPIIQASTSEVYGNSTEIPFNESQNLVIGPSNQPRWSYATGKLLTEQLFLMGNFPSTIVRFFNIVGPRQVSDYGMVMPSFIEKFKNNTAVTVYGEGNTIRCFCDISDCVDMLVKLTETEIENEVYNIGNPYNQITIANLALLIKRFSCSTSNIITKKYNEVFKINSCDIIKRIPDISKISMKLNYTPRTSLNEIIMKLI